MKDDDKHEMGEIAYVVVGCLRGKFPCHPKVKEHVEWLEYHHRRSQYEFVKKQAENGEKEWIEIFESNDFKQLGKEIAEEDKFRIENIFI